MMQRKQVKNEPNRNQNGKYETNFPKYFIVNCTINNINPWASLNFLFNRSQYL